MHQQWAGEKGFEIIALKNVRTFMAAKRFLKITIFSSELQKQERWALQISQELELAQTASEFSESLRRGSSFDSMLIPTRNTDNNPKDALQI